jgi:hypothetical protein
MSEWTEEAIGFKTDQLEFEYSTGDSDEKKRGCLNLPQ